MDELLAFGPDGGPGEAAGLPHGDVTSRLGGRSVVLVGLMGAGKTTIGRRLAGRIGLPFRDADLEIEAAAAGMSIPEIFATYGEASFRDVERRVIERLLAGPQIVLATGGGAYMNPQTRELIGRVGVSVWLRADLDTLMRRVARRTNRPLLRTENPADTMRRLMKDRYPVYELADLTVESHDLSHARVTQDVVEALLRHAPAGLPLP